MTEAIVKKQLSSGAKILGILALIFGIGAIVLWGIVFVPLALITSILALAFRNYVYGGVGLVCAILGIFLSPTLLALIGMGGLWLARDEPVQPNIKPKVTSMEESKEAPKPLVVEKAKQAQPANPVRAEASKIQTAKVLPPPSPPIETTLKSQVSEAYLKTIVFGSDDSLGFKVAKLQKRGESESSWCADTAQIAVITPQNKFIQNSLGILQTASQLTQFECDQATQVDVAVIKNDFDGSVEQFAGMAYFSGLLKNTSEGWTMQ